MNKFVLRQSLLLLLTATIWGFAFVAQSVSMDYIGPFTFNAARNLIGAVVLLPFIALNSRKAKKEGNVENNPQENKVLLVGGVCCGVLLAIAGNLQQFGIQYTTVGKAGFVTAMYIVLVPILGIFLKKKAGIRIWIGVAIAVLGLYLLCMTDGSFSFQKGDMLMLCCALFFSFQILAVDYFVPKVNGVKLACLQFFVCALVSAIGMFITETPNFTMIAQAWMPILYAGVLSCGVGYTLQIIGQRGMNPTVASLIMSLESVISVIAGWLLLSQKLTERELIGCAFMFGAIVLVQLPTGKKNSGSNRKTVV